MLQFCEYFYSLQGEGRYCGTPSLFFRFSGCNMTCSGFGSSFMADDGVEVMGCDSAYAVNKEHFSHSWKSIDASYLIHILDEHTEEYPFLKNIVLTGGEPLLYSKDESFLEFLNYAHNKNIRITIETNASINIDFKTYPIYKNIVFALSVKLSNSGEKKDLRIKNDVIKNISNNAKDTFFKFTVDSASLSKGLGKEIKEITKIADIEVYCMALSQNSLELRKEEKELVNFCLINGYTYSDRLHIRLNDGERGK